MSLAWDANNCADGPQGSRYMLDSEHIRGEGRHWFARLRRADGTTATIDGLSNGTYNSYGRSKAAAKAMCKAHARSWEK
jgi:hypothetical protein